MVVIIIWMRRLNIISERGRGQYAARRLGTFAERCRQSGLAVTPQRIAIIRALLASPNHPRADDIYARVRREHPHVSLATVHRTLETLCQVGEARKVTHLHDSARYDGNVEPHHHVVCIRCHKVRDLEVPDLDGVLEGRTSLGEFTLLGCSVEIHALCRKCQLNAAINLKRRRASGSIHNHKNN